MQKQSQKDSLHTLLQEHGYKMTQPRKAVAQIFHGSSTPLSADDIVMLTSGKLDRVTVYRTLELFELVGYIIRVSFRHKTCYELSRKHGHYLVCKKCDCIEKLSVCTIPSIEKKSLKHSKRFASLDAHSLQLLGTCKQCQK